MGPAALNIASRDNASDRRGIGDDIADVMAIDGAIADNNGVNMASEKGMRTKVQWMEED